MTTAEIAPLFVFRDNNSAIHSVCFDTINNHPNLFSGSLDGSISIYDTKKFKKISQFNQCHQNAINKLIYSQNNQLVSQGRDGYVKFWSVEQGGLENVSSIQTRCTSFCKFDISADNQYMACSIDDPNLFSVWDLKSSTPTFTTSDLKHGMYMCLTFVQVFDRPFLTSLSDDGYFIVWDIINNKLILDKKVHKESGLSICITKPKLNSKDEQISQILTGGADGDIHLMNMNWSKMTLTDECTRSINNGVQDIVIRSDQKLVATGGWDHRVRIFSIKKLKPLAILKYHNKSIQSLSFCQKTNLLASSSSDGKISIWDIYNN